MSAGDLRDRIQAAPGASYRLERELGGGGMSRVFLAEETALGRPLVIKVVAQELAEGLSAERFPRSARFDKLRRDPRAAAMLDKLGAMP
jgi:serine/threonine protein kinase